MHPGIAASARSAEIPLLRVSVPHIDALDGEANTTKGGRRVDFAGKAVFVGFAEQLQPEQRDGFYTVFSQPDGLDISGVEIGATAFANILERRHVEPVNGSSKIAILALWGMLVCVVSWMLPAASLVAASAIAVGGYMGAAHAAFGHDGTWLPIVVPVMVQTPVALVGALVWRYLDARRERETVRKALKKTNCSLGERNAGALPRRTGPAWRRSRTTSIG